jgi:hypothetical protein
VGTPYAGVYQILAWYGVHTVCYMGYSIWYHMLARYGVHHMLECTPIWGTPYAGVCGVHHMLAYTICYMGYTIYHMLQAWYGVCHMLAWGTPYAGVVWGIPYTTRAWYTPPYDASQVGVYHPWYGVWRGTGYTTRAWYTPPGSLNRPSPPRRMTSGGLRVTLRVIAASPRVPTALDQRLLTTRCRGLSLHDAGLRGSRIAALARPPNEGLGPAGRNSHHDSWAMMGFATRATIRGGVRRELAEGVLTLLGASSARRYGGDGEMGAARDVERACKVALAGSGFVRLKWTEPFELKSIRHNN